MQKIPILCAFTLLLIVNTFSQNPVELQTSNSSHEPESGTVQGQVVSAATGKPLKGARVVLIDRRPYGEFPEGLTDSNGHFFITGVPAGTYHFRASKLGYVEQAYHPDASGRAQLLTLAPGSTVDKVLFRLGRAGVIAGRVTDETGEPLVNVAVIALVSQTTLDYVGRDAMATWPAGLNLFQIALTNDLGEYRLYNLPPGGYYVAANDTRVNLGMMGVERPARGLDRTMGMLNLRTGDHPLLYYPGVFKVSEAQKVHLTAGQEAHIDLSLRPVKLLTVSGHVFEPNGKPAVSAHVQLTSPTASAEAFSEELRASTDVQGYFEIKKVLPGSYTTAASLQVYGGRGNEGNYWGEQPIEVVGDNISGLQLQLTSELEISGKVSTLEGAKHDLRGIGVSVDGADVYLPGGGQLLGGRSDDVTEDGTFHVAGLGRTTYRVRMTGLPEEWYVRSAVFGTQNVLDSGLNLAGADARHSLEITISPGVAQVNGVVLRGDYPVPGAKVQLLPDPANPFRENRYSAVWADDKGHFVVKNVAPGSYRVLAVDVENVVEEDELESPASVSVTLVEKESKTVKLQLDKRRE
jgi:hypothetical protein